ncbi:hypothetical protein [Streptomyces humi]|uniref:hypothetical protein n=1 Tax=Streptomyces humi TaxID=1428620 RepID=UPI0019D0D831|nr:hypothetical protein [Streptomyces humi]
MPADEVTHGTEVDESRVRTGPRHAAPKKPLFTRFQMPAGKAIASVAMPTAVIMGMGFTSTLAIADTNNTSASSKSLAEDYKNCVSALDSASPSASASASDKATDSATPSATASDDAKDSTSSSGGKSSSSDSGSDDTATPTPSATKSSSSSDGSGSSSGSSGSDGTATPSPSASASSGGGLLDSIGDAITGILSGGSTTSSSSSDSTASATPTPSASAGSDSSSSSSSSSSSKDSGSDTVSKTVKKVTDTVKDTTDTATKAADEVTKDATEAADDATSSASPSPSASSTTSADDCEAATDDVSGVDNKVAVADDPWYLSASSLLLKSADYQGVVEVKTASGKTKKVLKYVISGGTDIGDLHQTVKDTKIDKTYHVQAASGSTSTIRDGDTTMYTESISGNLFGLIPITFSPDSPPPLNIPLIYFTNVKVVQAAQFGGTLHVPGMHVYTTDGAG